MKAPNNKDSSFSPIDKFSLNNSFIKASIYGNLEMLYKCLEKGAEIDYRDETGSTALIYASALGMYKIVEFLLKNGAKRRLKDNNGYTAIDYAKENKNTAILSLLVR